MVIRYVDVTEPKQKRISLVLSEEDKNKLDVMREYYDISQSEVIRRLLRLAYKYNGFDDGVQ